MGSLMERIVFEDNRNILAKAIYRMTAEQQARFREQFPTPIENW